MNSRTSLSDAKSILIKCVELSKYYKLGIAVAITSLCSRKFQQKIETALFILALFSNIPYFMHIYI